MNKQPFVTIVMRNHNAYNLTSTCLRSLYACTYQNFEIVVVDDGSNDNSGQSLKLEFPKLIVLTSKKYIEYCRGLNLGIRYALDNNADYVFVVNNDTDNFSKNYLEVMVDCFLQDSSIGMVGSLVYDFDGNKRSAGTPQYRLGVYVDTPTEGYMFSKTVLREVGLFDEQLVRYFEDYDYLIRMRNLGFKSFCTHEVQFDHLGGGTSKKQTFVPNYYRVRNLLWFIKRYRSSESFIWKFNQFKGFMKKHILLILTHIKKGRLLKSMLVAGSVMIGLVVGIFTKWDNNSYD